MRQDLVERYLEVINVWRSRDHPKAFFFIMAINAEIKEQLFESGEVALRSVAVHRDLFGSADVELRLIVAAPCDPEVSTEVIFSDQANYLLYNYKHKELTANMNVPACLM